MKKFVLRPGKKGVARPIGYDRFRGVLNRGERSSVVERHLAKVAVVGSTPIARSIFMDR